MAHPMSSIYTLQLHHQGCCYTIIIRYLKTTLWGLLFFFMLGIIQVIRNEEYCHKIFLYVSEIKK